MSGFCIFPEGKPNNQGYVYQTVNGVLKGAHVHAYEAAYGPVPKGYDVHHTCLNHSCVQPLHLEALTKAEHYRRHASTDRPISKTFSIPSELAAAIVEIAQATGQTQSAIVTDAIARYVERYDIREGSAA
jgi:hypothetical protein